MKQNMKQLIFEDFMKKRALKAAEDAEAEDAVEPSSKANEAPEAT